jgi:hypothetical protein
MAKDQRRRSHLRQNASQGSIDRQFSPLIEEENLSEQPEDLLATPVYELQ